MGDPTSQIPVHKGTSDDTLPAAEAARVADEDAQSKSHTATRPIEETSR